MNYFANDTNVQSVSPKQKKTGRGGGWVLKNSSVLSSIFILLVCSFILFVANFNLSESTITENAISVTMVILFFATYSLYLNGYSIGKERNEVNPIVLAVYKDYNEKVKQIRENDRILDLDGFREWYIATELREAREAVLQAVDLTMEDYKRIKEGTSKLVLTKKQKKAVKKVGEIQPIRLTRQMILSCRPYSGRRNPIKDAKGIEAYKYSQFTLKFIATAFTSMFVVSLGVELLFGASWEVVVQSIIKVATLVISFFSGAKIGKRYSNDYADRTRDILGLLEEFDDWLKTKKKPREDIVEALKTKESDKDTEQALRIKLV